MSLDHIHVAQKVNVHAANSEFASCTWAVVDVDVTATEQGFSAALNSMPLAVRKRMAYGQSREMAKHAEITLRILFNSIIVWHSAPATAACPVLEY